MVKFNKALLLSVSALPALVNATEASAQQAPVPEEQSTGPMIEDIVVTAEKRPSKLQEVPMAISAFTMDDVKASGINNTQDLQLRVPGLVYGQENGFAQPYIRGVGTAFASSGLETSIATYIDGVYVQQQTGAVTQLVDLERVEVLKGPQGTLYGRNATGGAIVVRTHDPVETVEGRVMFGYGRFGRVQGEAMLNVPLSDTLSLRVAGQVDNRTKGYITNVFTGNKLGQNHSSTGRIKLAWRPDSGTEVIASVETSRNRDRTNAHKQGAISVCTACNIFGLTVPDGFYEVDFDNEPRIKSDYTFATLRASTEITDTLKLSSTSAYRTYFFGGSFDQDFTRVDLLSYVTANRSHTFEQEFNLASSFNGPFNFIVGAFYEHDKTNAPASLPGIALGTPAPASIKDKTLLDAASVFGEIYYNVTDKVKITLGGRYNYDKRSLEIDLNNAAKAVFGSTDFKVSKSFKNFTPRAVIAYNDGDVNLYASYSKGFKSGGFNALVFAEPPPVNPEKLRSFEVGGKFAFFDRRVRLNVSVFDYKYTDMQVTFYDPVTSATILRNAASSSIYGADMDLTFAATQELTLNLGGSYLNTKFDAFPSGSVYAQGAGSYVLQSRDLTGERLPYTPEFSGFVNVSYNAPITDKYNVNLTATANYSDGYDFLPAGGGPLRLDRQKSLTRINLTGGVSTADNTWRVGFYVENLTNKKYFNARLPVGFGDQALVALPRTFGANVEYRF